MLEFPGASLNWRMTRAGCLQTTPLQRLHVSQGTCTVCPYVVQGARVNAHTQVMALNARGLSACFLGSAQRCAAVTDDAWAGKYRSALPRFPCARPGLASSPG